MQTYSILSLWALLARRSLLFCFTGSLMAACSDGSDRSSAPVEPVEPPAMPFQELFDQGLDRYLGEYTPMVSDQADGIVTHTFGAGDGPLCLDGSEYRMATLNAESEDLMIFLQGGGACWSELCLATASAPAGIPQNGFLNPNRADNPVNSWNVAYFPYCDGGLHGSDRDSDTDGNGDSDRFQRGLHNLSAGLDVTVANFPSPRRVLLMGASGGGLGTTLALPLVRKLYPNVPIDIVNDSGVGTFRPDQPAFVDLLLSDWNLGAFLPASCENCLSDDGHLSNYHIWQMDEDKNVRRSMLSYSRDTVFGNVFLKIGLDAFEEALYPQMQKLENAHPDRSHYWIPSGEGHTFVQARTVQTAGGISVMAWIAAMLDGSGDWVSVQD